MHKRFLSMLLVLAMVFSFVPVSVVTAAGAVEASPKAGTHTTTGHTCEDCGQTNWQPWPTDGTIPTDGHYYLTQNVELTAMVKVLTGQKLHLCLNGYVMTAASGARIMSASQTGCEIVITDCTAYTDENGAYHAGVLTGGVAAGDGGGVSYVYADSALKLYDGILTGNIHKSDSKGGGAISLRNKSDEHTTGGSFYMYGGLITENRAYKANGTTEWYGGAIYGESGAMIQIEGGTISDNRASAGGAIYSKSANVTVKNALITGNRAKNAGAIYFDGSAQAWLEDCTITGNTGTSDNIKYGYSAAVLNAGSTAKLTLSGKVVIADNTTYGSVADVSFSKDATDTLYIHNLEEGSRVVFATPVTAATDAKEVIALSTQQTAPWQSGWVRWLSAIDGTGSLKDVGLVNNEFVWGHYHGDQVYTALENADQLMAGGHYYLAGDVQLTKQADLTTNSMTLDLCLNGHDLKPAEGKQIIKLGNKNVTCNIYDCTAYTDAEGTYHAGSLTGVDVTSTGGAFYVGGSDTLHLYDGKITGNKAGNAAGAILYGTMYMHGGEISGNTVTKNGAGVYIGKNTGKFYMYGGTMTGNTANNGAGIYVAANAVLEIKDAAITGNTAAGAAGGVFVVDGATVTLSGNVQINKNKAGENASNLYLQDTTLTLKDLDSKAKIGITLEPDRITGNQLTFTGELTNDLSGNFTSDDSAYKVELKDKKLTLVENTVTPPPVQGHTHNGCNDTACTDHAQITYEAWTDAKALPTEGNWYLDTDVTVEATIKLAENTNKTINICLNGHTITQKAGTNAQMYNTSANAGVKISIADCTAKTEGGVYTAGKIKNFVMNSVTEGATMYLRNGTTLELFDGIFENNKTIGKSAGAMLIDGTFHMYGGMFVGNTAGDGTAYNGGAIYLNKNSKATITGGIFKNNSGKHGGAIYMGRDAAHLVENVTFIGNTAKEVGGALSLGDDTGAGIIVKNCTFESNKAGTKGGAIRAAGVTRIEGCTFTGNQGGEGAVYVSDGSDLTLAGANSITGNQGNLYLEAEEIIRVESATGLVGVSAEVPGRAFTADCADLADKFASDDADYQVAYREGKLWLASSFEHKHCVCGDTACTEHEQVTFLPWDETNSLPEQGNYCLLNDVTLTASHSIDGDLTLCLHGHTVTTSAKSRLFSLPNQDVVLTITDCTAKTEDGVYTAGKLTGGVDRSDGGGAAVFVRAGATLKLYEGIITDNKTVRDGGGGGAIMLQSTKNDMIASFYMYGGEISNNQACSADGTPNRLGGGIYAYRESVFVMEGGVIKNNEAATGAGIYAANARLTIKGQVTDNIASVAGGGIYMTIGATITVDGKVNITGNTAGTKASNLCLEGDHKMAVGTLDAAAKIAVTGQPLSYITESCPDYTANFLPDNAKYQITYREGAIYLDAAGNHKHCFCIGTASKCDHTVQTFVEWDDPTSLPTSGNYFLSVDVELPGQVTLEATTLNLCLNGHNIKVVGEDTRAFYTKGDAILRIIDCAEKPGSISGGTRGAILTENNDESAALIELWGGIITGNSTTTVGGAILIQGTSTLNMYGGKITDNLHKSIVKVDKEGKPVLNSKGDQTVTSEHGGGAVGVHGAGTTFNMYGGEISGNRTAKVTYKKADGTTKDTSGLGGGVYAYYSVVNIYGGKITGNHAERNGGGIFSYYATVNLENVNISGNTADNSGGGAYFYTGSTVNIKSGTISNNTSKGSCAGVMASGKKTVLTMQGGTISGNNAGGSAGGVLVQSSAEMIMTGGKITGNSTKGTGGGMYISTKSKLTMRNVSITNNTAKSQAGGLMLNKATSTITNCTISYNTAQDNAVGGVKVAGGTLTASGMSVIGNKSKGSGGGFLAGRSSNTENGVKVEYYATCNLYGCTFADNESEGSAGGMLLQSVGTVANVQNCTFTGNKAGNSGGGFYAASNVTFTMKDCKVIGNEANSAAGLRLSNKQALVENVVVADNLAATSAGGGVYVSGENCVAELKNLEIYGNEANSAGGMTIQKATAKVSDCKIYENKARTSSGGGLSISSNAIAELQNLEIWDNEAAKMAGGLYTGAGTRVTADNLNIHHNQAREAGGGAQLGGLIVMTNCNIANNSTDGTGGGIMTWTSGSKYTGLNGGPKVFDSKIVNNTAGSQGGAVYVQRGGPIEMTNVEISGNESGLEGGAIYSDGKMKLKDMTITDNTSLAGKYTIYMTPAETDGYSYYTGYKTMIGTIVIKDNEGGGVYLAEGIPLVLEGQLGEGSYIPVTLSDGVVTRRVLGVYNYEGGNLEYVLTAGNRSITEPEEYVPAEEETQPGETPTTEGNEPAAEGEDNTMLYAGIGGIAAVVILAAIILVVVKKKKSASAESK